MLYPRRRPLVQQASVTITGSTNVGISACVDVGYFTNFSGLYSVVGSITFQIRSGVASGSFQVTSASTINSGTGIISAPNYGKFADFVITAANSQASLCLLLNGEL